MSGSNVDGVIVKTILPRCYEAIDDLIDMIGHSNIPKEQLIAYRRLLPGLYRNSFEARKPPARKPTNQKVMDVPIESA